ncbi:hypothetical protein, partial [Rhizobium sp.]|uniref:hypothetical protein n=1 Tax=Rhizobium sp. TaxID=391 RepID=UPI000E804BEB|nr:hypothetical protein [Rhizobium sp.]
EAWETLGRRYNYTVYPLNLYRAHEAIINLVARLVALEEKSDTPILMQARHCRACASLEQASTSQRSCLAA